MMAQSEGMGDRQGMAEETPARLRRRITDQLLEQGPEWLGAEIIDDEQIPRLRPDSPHILAASAIVADLFGPFSDPAGDRGGVPGGWWILFEPEIHLAQDIVVPDIAGWRRERLPQISYAPAFELTPDWVCEIILPNTARLDRVRKTAIYGREKISHLWLVDPLAQTLEVYRLTGHHWIRIDAVGGPELVRAEPFEDIELNMRRWWIDTASAPARAQAPAAAAPTVPP
jgi:hypothetical protein